MGHSPLLSMTEQSKPAAIKSLLGMMWVRHSHHSSPRLQARDQWITRSANGNRHFWGSIFAWLVFGLSLLACLHLFWAKMVAAVKIWSTVQSSNCFLDSVPLLVWSPLVLAVMVEACWSCHSKESTWVPLSELNFESRHHALQRHQWWLERWNGLECVGSQMLVVPQQSVKQGWLIEAPTNSGWRNLECRCSCCFLDNYRWL